MDQKPGANQIVGAYLCYHRARRVFERKRGFVVRKAEKDHGKSGLIVGSVMSGDRVCLVEDVTTTGGSLLTAAERITEFGCKVALALTIVDRLEGAAEAFEKKQIPFKSILTIQDLGVS